MKNLILTYLVLFSAISFAQTDQIGKLHSDIEKLGLNLPRQIDLYYEILELDSNDYKANLGLGQAYYSRWKILGRTDQVYLDSALIQLNKACFIENADYKAFSARGNLYFDFKKFDLAFPDLTKVIELNPSIFNARWKRASIYMKRNQFREAIEDLTFALKIEEPSDWIFLMRANCYANLNEYRKCKKDVDNALRINEKSNDNILALGDYYALTGNYKKAIEKYSFIINRNNLYGIAYLKRANVYNKLGKFDQAKVDWKIAESKGLLVNDRTKEIKFGAY